MNTSTHNKVKYGLKYLFIADALAMPVHWYYRVADIYKAFPHGISRYEDAPSFHPSSIMSLHSTVQGGRKGKPVKHNDHVQIVGDVILKGRAHHWEQANIHYHQGMLAGENTLNAHCVRVLLRSYSDLQGSYDAEHYIEQYIAFMTADPPQHTDSYAESYHRAFFANLKAGNKPLESAGITHDTPSIGGLIGIGPLAALLCLKGMDEKQVVSICQRHLYLTHPDQYLAQVCADFVGLICQLIENNDASYQDLLGQTAQRSAALNLAGMDVTKLADASVIGGRYSKACYITDSWPGVLYLAYKYYNQPIKALLANTNLGGDNVHRGAVLGFILGLINAARANETEAEAECWFTQLTAADEIAEEIESCLSF